MNTKNKIKAIVAFAIALAFIMPVTVFANEERTFVDTTVSIDPLTQTVNNGDSFTVDVYVVPGEPISGVQCDLYFDETLIQAVSVVEGDIFSGYNTWFSPGIIDNVNGKIEGTQNTILDPVAVSDPGVFVTISFTALDTLGTSPLDLDAVKVIDYDGDPVSIIVNDGNVTVEGEVVVTLTMIVSGSGTTYPAPGVYDYILDTVVDLEAISDIGWSFDHWVGDVDNSSSAITSITMNENKVVTAYFTEDCYILTVSTVGDGVINIDPYKTCYLYGESVNLTAVADPNWTFKEWSGDLNSSNSHETIIMDDDKAVTATFTEEQHVLNIVISGNGIVIKNPDQDTYDYGTLVELTAVAGQYWRFDHWSGDLTGNNSLETIIMDSDKYVTATFIGDTEPPETTHNLSGIMGENGWYIGPVTVTLIATDNWSGVASTWYRWADHIWRLYEDEPFIVKGDKKHTLEYFSIDRANNVEPINKVIIKIDTTPPVTTHDFKGMMVDDLFITNVTVSFSVHDATAGVNYTKYKIDNGNWTNYADPFNITENGIYIISYYSVDFAGHIEETNDATLEIEKDEEPPVTKHEFSGMMEDDWYVSDVTVTLTATDNAAGVNHTKYKIDGGSWKKYYNPFYVNEDGSHTIDYYSVDKVGNKEKEKNASFKIDKTKPTIDLAAEGSGSTWLLIATVYDETSGIAKVEFYVDDASIGEVTEYPYELEYTEARSGDKAQAIAYDNAGNTKMSLPVDAIPQSQDPAFARTFLLGLITNMEESENIITAQATWLRYIEISSTGINVGFVKMTVVEFSSHNLLGRRIRSFGQMSLVFGIFKGGITIENE